MGLLSHLIKENDTAIVEIQRDTRGIFCKQLSPELPALSAPDIFHNQERLLRQEMTQLLIAITLATTRFQADHIRRLRKCHLTLSIPIAD